MHGDDSRILRLRDGDLDDSIGRAAGEPAAVAGDECKIVRTVTVGTYPTAAARYYAVQEDLPGGVEQEGGTVTYTAEGSGTFFAFNSGSAIPPSGTRLLATRVNGGRWGIEYNG